jgi:hypothetical protein
MAFRNSRGETQNEEHERIDTELRAALEDLIVSHNQLVKACEESLWPDSNMSLERSARAAEERARKALALEYEKYPDDL